MFNVSGGMVITGGTFTIVNQCHHSGSQLLYQRIASGVMHDSAERFPAPKLHPKANLAIISEILDWIDQPPDDAASSAPRILWLNGPTGSGKTALAQSITEICQRNGKLGASFFFPRNAGDEGSKLASKLVLTLAYQLAISLPEAGRTIHEVVVKDPAILDKSMAIQMERLIAVPMSSIESPVTIMVIDGLDVCEDEAVQQQVLSFLATGANCISSLRFILTSRKAAWIHKGFGIEDLSSCQKAYQICTDRALAGNRRATGGLLRDGFAKVLTNLWRSNSIP